MATETTYSTYLQQFSVKIRYKLVGSGTLVKINSSCIYLITAKHNLKEDEKSIINDTFIKDLENNLNDISIERDNKDEQFCIVEDIVYCGDENLDLIIFSVKAVKGKNYLQELPCLKILQHEHSRKKFKEYFFYGYPNDKNGTIITGLVEPDYAQEESYKFRLDGGTQKEKYLKGFSGSSLFIENNGKFYLVGLVIQVDEKLHKYTLIDLYVILDDMNKELVQGGKEALLSEKLLDVSTSKQEEIIKNLHNNIKIKELSAGGDIHIHIGDNSLQEKQVKYFVKKKNVNNKKIIKEFKESSKKVLTYMMKKTLFIGIFIFYRNIYSYYFYCVILLYFFKRNLSSC